MVWLSSGKLEINRNNPETYDYSKITDDIQKLFSYMPAMNNWNLKYKIYYHLQ